HFQLRETAAPQRTLHGFRPLIVKKKELFCARSTREAASLPLCTAGYPQAKEANFVLREALSSLTLRGVVRSLAAPLCAPACTCFSANSGPSNRSDPSFDSVEMP